MNVKQYILSKYGSTAGLEHYDLSEGTNIYDLVISPLGEIFEDAFRTQEISSVREMRSWGSLADISMLEDAKNIAKMRGVEPAVAARSTTLLTLYFSSPVDWELPRGSSVSSGNAVFYTRDDIAVEAKTLSTHVDRNSRLYYVDNVYVYNDNAINIAENMLGYITDAPPELVKITHPAVTNGISSDTAKTLAEKIRWKEKTITANSVESIKTLAAHYFPGVDVEVICSGDPRMRRDIVYNMIPGTITPKQESGYGGKLRRNNQIVNSQAYLMSVPEGEIVNAYAPEDEHEFTQGQYLSIAEGIDSSVYFSTNNILGESFTQSSEKIGNTTDLLVVPLPPTRYLYVYDTAYFASGDTVNIADRTGVQPTQNGTIEEIQVYSSATCAYAAGVITGCAVDSAQILCPNCRIVITDNTGTEFDGYVAVVGEGTITLISPPEGLGIGTVSIVAKRICLYSNINVAISVYTNMYVGVVNSEGLYIGPGWVKSEHNMPIGTFISENQISVIDGELVMGVRFDGQQVNVVKQVFLRYGIRNLLTRLMANTDISVIAGNGHPVAMPILPQGHILDGV